MNLRTTLSVTIAAAAVCFGVSDKLTAATAPIITYKATGTFSSTPLSGTDTLKLAGEPFSVTIPASAASVPYKTGPTYAAYDKLKLTGTVHSGLVGTTPVNIGSGESTIIQGINPNQYDQFQMEAPVRVVGISLTIKATIIMPLGTVSKPLLHPFTTPVAMAPGNATMTYSDGTNTTVLAIQTGSLSATIPTGDVVPAVQLHSAGVEAVTLHEDGTTTVRSIGEGSPVDLGLSTDAVTLKFYAYGVSDASEVHVQIAGEEVPVVYAGASGYFSGLDEVMVQLPRSMAGRGAVGVTLTADGQSAKPIEIRLQ